MGPNGHQHSRKHEPREKAQASRVIIAQPSLPRCDIQRSRSSQDKGTPAMDGGLCDSRQSEDDNCSRSGHQGGEVSQQIGLSQLVKNRLVGVSESGKVTLERLS